MSSEPAGLADCGYRIPRFRGGAMNGRTSGKNTFWFAVVLCAITGVFCGSLAFGKEAAAPAGEKSVQGTVEPTASVLDVKYGHFLGISAPPSLERMGSCHL